MAKTIIPSTLHAEKVSKFYKQGSQEICVLKDISATFNTTSSYAIIGASGSGKSTLLHILAGLDSPTQGAVFFNTADIFLWAQQEKEFFLSTTLGLMFQQPYLIKELTVLENVVIKGHIAKKSNKESEEKAQQLLNSVGLSDKMDNYPGQLSGGQQQRVALARALMNGPQFLLADEPTGSLDVATGHEMVELLLKLKDEWRMGLIICSHEPYVYQKMEHRFEIKDGTLYSRN